MTTEQQDAVDDARRDAKRVRITVELEQDLVDALTTAARDRIIGRALLIEYFLRDGLAHLVPVSELYRNRTDRTTT